MDEALQMYEALEMYEAMYAAEPEPPLLQAVRAGRTAELKLMLTAGTDVNVRSPFDGSSALHLAAIHGRSRIASVLLKVGADEDALDEAGETPLMKAAELGHQPVMDILLNAGADTNVVSCSCARGRAALHFAAGEGHHGIVKALVDRGADADVQDDRGYTPMMWAILGGFLPTVNTLLVAGADPTIRNNAGVTALHGAANTGHSDIVATLLQAGVGKDILDDDGDTPLMWASRAGHLPVVRTLVNAGANQDVCSMDDEGLTALHAAAGEGYNSVVKTLLKSGANKDTLNKLGETPLIVAVSRGQLRVVKTLLDFGANFTIATTPQRHTALHYAAHVGREDIVSVLLASGAETLVTDSANRTPLVWAARDGNTRVVEVIMAQRTALGESSTDGCLALLLATRNGRDGVVSAILQGANKDALDCDGESPLIWAVTEGHLPMVNALVAAGVNVNARRGSDGSAVLHIAAGRGRDEMVSSLLRKGAYKDVLDNTGTTPLLWATAAGHLSAVETLLAAGANLNLRSREDDFSALHLAAGNGYHGIVSALLRSGADADVVDPNGDTALMWAAGNGHVGVVEVLLTGGADVTVRNSVEGEGYSALDWATKGGHVGIQEAIRGRLDGATKGVDVDGVLESVRGHTADPNDGDEEAWHRDSCDDQIGATEALNLGHRGQTETVPSLTERGGLSLGGVLSAPGWLDLEGIGLAVALLLWFSARCKLRS